MDFKLVSTYKPQGDQGQAIEALTRVVFDREQHQVLLGVTGSGKTFTAAKIIESVNRPALVMAHNKTLAAQLYQSVRAAHPDDQLVVLIPIVRPTKLRYRILHNQIDLVLSSALRARDDVVVARVTVPLERPEPAAGTKAAATTGQQPDSPSGPAADKT